MATIQRQRCGDTVMVGLLHGTELFGAIEQPAAAIRTRDGRQIAIKIV
ncbi:MAG: hypothetical protein ACOYOJ_10135 [Alsobacter sp.]